MSSQNSSTSDRLIAAPAPEQPLDRILRLTEVIHATGLGRNTIYRQMNEGLFPLAVELGGCRVGWRQSAIRAWIDSRPTNTQVRTKPRHAPWEHDA